MILILDDDPARHEMFDRRLGAGVTTRHVRTAREALTALRETVPTTLCLDYDLDQHGLDIHTTGTGGDVASALIGRSRCFPGMRVLVHSINPLRGYAMAQSLATSGYHVTYLPGAWMSTTCCRALARWDRSSS